MLNGLDPIILFSFSKATPATIQSLSKIPLASDIVEQVGLPAVPVYLSEKLTGLYIDSEDKNIDIETSTTTLISGEAPQVNQKGINSTVRIDLVASKESIGVTLLSAMADLIFQKVTSKEYSITYLHGAITVFGGLLHSFSINQNADNDLYRISIELSRSGIQTQEPIKIPVVPGLPGVSL